MKKRIFIIVLVIIVLAIVSFMIFNKNNRITIDNNKNLDNLSNNELITLDNIENLDDLSNNELIAFSNSGAKFPNGFIDKNLDNYERIINSSDSIEDAKNAVLKAFNNNNMGFKNEVTKNNIILQTDNYYGLDVSWLYTPPDGDSTTYSEKVISFKKSIYDREKNIFNSKNKETIKEVLNLIYYMDNNGIGGSKVLQSSISETSDYFEYTIYYIRKTYGDWGINDVLHFKKDIQQINKITGEVSSRNSVELKEVEIDETAPSIN